MALNGWKRLWVVWGALSAVLAVAWTVDYWPRPDDMLVREFANGTCADVTAHVIAPTDPTKVPEAASIPVEASPESRALPKGIHQFDEGGGVVAFSIPLVSGRDISIPQTDLPVSQATLDTLNSAGLILFRAGTAPALINAALEAQVRAAHLWLVPPGCMELARFHEFAPQTQIQSLDQYIRDLRFKRAMLIGIALFVWAVVMVIVYVIGWTVAWVRRGFAQAPR